MNNILENVVQELWHSLQPNAAPRQRAETIYEWMTQNLSYDYDRWNAVLSGEDRRQVIHPGEVLEKRKGICSDLAYAYVTLGRRFGLKAQYARVPTKDDKGELAYHTFAIVTLDGKEVQVDPTHKLFGAKHKGYQIEEPFVDDPSARHQDQDTWQPSYNLREQSRNRLYGLGRKLAALALLAGLLFGTRSCWEWRKQQNVQYCETKDEARFTTKNGEMRFAVSPEAAQPWKETLFFAEAIKGDLSDYELLEVYARADANKDSVIHPLEARAARDFARAMYLKSKQ